MCYNLVLHATVLNTKYHVTFSFENYEQSDLYFCPNVRELVPKVNGRSSPITEYSNGIKKESALKKLIA